MSNKSFRNLFWEMEEKGVKTLLDLGDGDLLTEDWTNSTVTEEVCLYLGKGFKL